MKYFAKGKLTRIAVNKEVEELLERKGFSEVDYETYCRIENIEIPEEVKTAKK